MAFSVSFLAATMLSSGLSAATQDSNDPSGPLANIKNILVEGWPAAPQDRYEENMRGASSDDARMLSLHPRLKDMPPGSETIAALDVAGHVFIPLDDAIRSFDSPVKFDNDHTASGFFLSPDNSFYFNFDKRELRVGDRHWEMTARDARRYQGRIYIALDSFDEWFGIDGEVDRAGGILHFSTDKKIPREERAAREKTWQALSAPDDAKSADIPQTRSFGGDATPGADVELYRDSVLVAGQVADAAGHYEFRDVPLRYGANVFNTKLYGLRGEYETRTDSVTVPLPVVETEQKKPVAPAPAIAAAPPVRAVAPPPPVKPAPPKPPVKEDAPYTGTGPFALDLTGDAIELAVTQGKLTLGIVRTYVDKQNTFLHIGQIIRLLGLSYKRDGAADTGTVTLKNDATILLDFGHREYIKDGEHHSFYYNDIYKQGDDYFANTELLNRLLPGIGFVADLSEHQIELADAEAIPANAVSIPAPALTPAPAVSPVIVDDAAWQPVANESASAPLASLREEDDVLHIVQTEKVAPKPEQPPPSLPAGPQPQTPLEGEEETLILQPRIKDSPPKDEFIEAIDKGGQIFLPLNDLVHIFEFPIKVEANTASGFFISPENNFSLDLDKHQVTAGDKSREIAGRDILRHEGQIYISTESFAEWFGIDSAINRGSATIRFMTERKLPQEEKEEREKRWHALLAETESNDKDYPLLQNPYQAIGYPSVDVNLGTGYAGGSQAGTGQSQPFASYYNIQGTEEIAYLTGQFYAQGSTQEGALNVLRLSAGRKDPDGALLGGMQATDFSFGDITSPSLSLVTTNSLGRGVSITNRDINASENFDFRNFTGDSVPGYEVELYRNDVLVAFQTVDASGRYNFDNIPILYGQNIFRTVFYGQQGQREEKVETISASSSLLKEGQFVYALGADQRGDSLIPLSGNQSSSPSLPPGPQAVGSARYGITRDFTVGAAVAETSLADGEHRYASATAGANLFGLLTEADLARDLTNNGWAGSAAALGGFEGVSIRARYRKFQDFVSEAVNSIDLPLTSDASLDANTQLYLPLLGSYSVGLSALHETFVDPTQVPRDTYSWRSSKSLWGVSFTDSVDYVVDAEKNFQDTFGVQTRLMNVELRADGIMQIKPVQQLQQATFTADYKIMDRLTAQTQYQKNLVNDQTTYAQNLNWDFDAYRLSLTTQMANTGGYSAGLNLIFSINHDATTDSWRTQPNATSGSGAVTGRVYIDENNNGKMDEGEPLVADAKVKVDGAPARMDGGNYYMAPVDGYQPAKLVLDPNSITDPLLTPATKGYRVITRPGDAVSADFALVRTTIIDGTVSFIDDKNIKHEMADIVVELEDKDGKPLRRVTSEIDGYFSFDKVQAGDYWLSVPDEVLQSLHASIDDKVPIKIDKIDEFMTGNEISLRQQQPLDAPPPMPPLPLPQEAPAAANDGKNP